MCIILLVEIRAFGGNKSIMLLEYSQATLTHAVMKETYFVTYDPNFVSIDSHLNKQIVLEGGFIPVRICPKRPSHQSSRVPVH